MGGGTPEKSEERKTPGRKKGGPVSTPKTGKKKDGSADVIAKVTEQKKKDSSKRKAVNGDSAETGSAVKEKGKPKKSKLDETPYEEEEEDDIEDDTNDNDEEFVPTRSELTLVTETEPSCSNSDDVDELDTEVQTGNRKEPEVARRAQRHINTVKTELRSIIDLKAQKATQNNFSADSATPFLAYNESWWNPSYLYRLPSDLTLAAIRRSGGEGVGRIEIGRDVGMDTATKSGNRRVSGFISNVCNDKKEYIGQFQKMEGKYRCIKYFWKAASQPERFTKLFEDFERLAGKPCPFKMGQVIKFPDSNLSTLRVSDVTLRRLNEILTMVKEERVMVTLHKVLKRIEARERAVGYAFSIDKKSLMKCLRALQSEKLVRTYETTVVADNISNQIEIVCHPDITSVEDTAVSESIQRVIDEYNSEGRVFPHGQLRYGLKHRNDERRAEKEALSDSMRTDEKILISAELEIMDRFKLYRNMISRAVVVSKEKKKESAGESEGGPDDGQTGDETEEPASESTPALDQSADQEGNNVITLLHGNGSNANELLDSVFSSTVKGTQVAERKTKMNIEMAIEYGYQAKAIRWFLLHEVVFQMVHGHEPETRPTLYEKFPPDVDVALWPERSVEELTVYRDELDPLRFVPPLPPFKDVKKGWIMVQDVAYALPLSIYVLVAYVGRAMSPSARLILRDYLSDPIKRHICIGDLPGELRLAILRDKRIFRQLDHILLSLSAIGLLAPGKSPDIKRFTTPASSVFFVARRGSLYDTSTSQKGYANISLPLSQYDKYDYEFNTTDDVIVYWHHLRALVQSTPLSFRNDFTSNDALLSRHKKYGVGTLARENLILDLYGEPDPQAALPRDGVCGFDSALFLHLRRHWDINTSPSVFVSWFITRFRRQSEAVRDVVESRVEKIQHDWNSYVKSLMPSDLDLTKNKKALANCNSNSMFPCTRASVSIDTRSKTRLQQGSRNYAVRKRKRPLDSVDIVSCQSRVHVRSRFNSRERDMLILIRAIGFFLNPVYRFWLDPAVLRDIMHEYVPESRTKTVQSLMAAGVREMVRPNRLAYLQRIVRNLSTFQEMRDLRFQLASAPLSTPEAKTTFFKNAFDIANRLLFFENQAMPHVSSTNPSFEEYLKVGKMVVSAEQMSSNPMPMRSRKPTSLSQIHHCVAINILLSILIHTTEGSFSEKILEQISATIIHQALQVLRTDGLVSRTRTMDPQLNVITKNQAVLSYYFRHFFAHRFHPDLIDQAAVGLRHIDDSIADGGCGEEEEEQTTPETLLEGDTPGLVAVVASAFYSGNELDVSVDDEILKVFETAAQEQANQSTKQIRYLENADLHFEQIQIWVYPIANPPIVPHWRTLVKVIDRSQSDEPPMSLADFLTTVSEEDCAPLTSIYDVISRTTTLGASMEDVVKESDLPRSVVSPLLSELISARLIVDVGVDCRRWVADEYSAAWCVTVDGRKVCPRPWTLPTGGICESTVRWMAESCMMAVVASPGILVRDLHFRFEFALQPAAIDDMICLLEAAECVTLCEEVFENMELVSPFEDSVQSTVSRYLLPTVSCIERFARIFASVPMPASMLPTIDKTASETSPEKSKATVISDDLTTPSLHKGITSAV